MGILCHFARGQSGRRGSSLAGVIASDDACGHWLVLRIGVSGALDGGFYEGSDGGVLQIVLRLDTDVADPVA